MLIVSYEFIGFLLLVFFVYYWLAPRFQWCVLLLASCVFYCAAGVKPFLFLVFTACTTYGLGRVMGGLSKQEALYIREHELDKAERKGYREQVKHKKWLWLLAGLFVNFGILAVLKYTNFAIYNVNLVLHTFGSERQFGFLKLLLPLGISYYTFQSMGYLIDVYRRKYEPEKNPARFFLFISFFPQLIQGPISRFDTLKESLFARHRLDWIQVRLGVERILWGYFKKLIVADRIAAVVAAISQDPEMYGGIYVLVGMLSYTVELYADFTGGIDITIGVAQALGVRLAENFLKPYSSKSLAEYWRRWHVTLMSWFREYIFYPVSVCRPVQKAAKMARLHIGEGVGKRIPVYTASVVVWLITGIWHGANWNFVSWGMANCVILLISQECEPLYKKFHERTGIGKGASWQAFCVARTILLVSSLQMFEYYPNAAAAFSMFGNMVTTSCLGQLWDGRMASFGLDAADFLLVGAGIGFMFLAGRVSRTESFQSRLARIPALVRFGAFYLLFLAVLLFGVYGIGYDASQFIYNQF